MSFSKQRPKWLKVDPEEGKKKGVILELDGYCESAQIAFEYQDARHYEKDHFFHKTPEDFEKLQSHDAAKVRLCRENGVRLLVIPHTANPLEACIRKQLRKLNIPFDNGLKVTPEVLERKRVLMAGSINMTDAMTASGLAKKYFFNAHYDGGKRPIYTLLPEEDSYIRDSYFGGRVELSFLGVVYGPLFYLDFTSLYPAMGYAHDMPYGAPKRVTFQDGKLPRHFFGFVRCRVRSTAQGKSRLPLHGVKNADSPRLPKSSKGKLLFPHLEEWRELTLFSEEIREGMWEGLYEYVMIHGIGFRRAPILKEVFQSLFAMKAKAKAEGKGAKEKAIKIMANSTYGFFGLNVSDREQLKICLNGDVPVYDYLARDALIEEVDHGSYTVLRVHDDLPVKDYNVAIAAAVTSYARMRLWKLMDAIQSRGGHCTYNVDTDSVTTNLDLSKHPDLLNEFIPDWEGESPGAELGSLKCECTDEVAKCVKKDLKKNKLPDSAADLPMEVRKKVAFKVRMAIERDSITWRPIPFYHPDGSGCISANKLYILRTQMRSKQHKTTEIVIPKAKGMPKYDKDNNPMFSFDQYAAMHGPNPEPLKCTQTQFRMPIYCDDGGMQSITIHRVPKEASARYDKGEVHEDGTVTAWVI